MNSRILFRRIIWYYLTRAMVVVTGCNYRVLETQNPVFTIPAPTRIVQTLTMPSIPGTTGLSTVMPSLTRTPEPPVTVTRTSTRMLSPTSIATVTFKPTETLTPTPTPYSINTLPPDQYLLYQDDNWINAVTLTGVSYEHVLELNVDETLYLTNDKRHLVVQPPQYGSPRIINLSDMSVTNIPLPSDYYSWVCSGYDISPDGKSLLEVCFTPDGEPFLVDEIYLYKLGENSLVRLTNCNYYGDMCFAPSWSPDGKWIAFYRGIAGSGQHITGMGLMKASCLSIPKDCQLETNVLLNLSPSYTWSSDSRYLAGYKQGSQVLVYQNLNGHFSLFKTILNVDSSSFLWSLDNQWIAFLSDGITMVSVQSDARKNLFPMNDDTLSKVNLIGWIELPIR